MEARSLRHHLQNLVVRIRSTAFRVEGDAHEIGVELGHLFHHREHIAVHLWLLREKIALVEAQAPVRHHLGREHSMVAPQKVRLELAEHAFELLKERLILLAGEATIYVPQRIVATCVKPGRVGRAVRPALGVRAVHRDHDAEDAPGDRVGLHRLVAGRVAVKVMRDVPVVRSAIVGHEVA